MSSPPPSWPVLAPRFSHAQFEPLLELARLVAGALPQPAAEGAAPAAAAHQAAAATMPQLAELLTAAAERCPPAGAPAPKPEPALPPELALQRERALTARPSCANPRCPNLEAPAKGMRCSGCAVARYCGEACSRAAWRTHKLACRQWGQQRQRGAS